MPITANRTLERLRAGEVAIGMSVRHLQGPVASLVAAAAGYDWLFIDTESSVLTVEEASQTAMAALRTGVTPIVRVHQLAVHEATRMLDNGAMGIIVPHVSTAAEAQHIASTLRYPPVGHRGWAGAQAHFGYVQPSTLEAQAQLDSQIVVIVMIETPEGVENARAIADVEGIDVLLVGTADLSTEMGVAGQTGHATVRDAFRRVADACAAAGKVVGIGGVEDAAVLSDFLGMGARFVASGSDFSMIMSAAKARAGAVRDLGTGKPAA